VTKITIGGRPPEEGGHKPFKLSLNDDIHKCLSKIKENGKNASQFVENYLKNPCALLDPGTACSTISEIAQIVEKKLDSAYQDRDYSKIQVYAELMGRLEPDISACGLSIPKNLLERKKESHSV
jgi:hypothetical protein